MKKFTKGCLITALVLFIVGFAFYGIFGLLGGFRQLESRQGHVFHFWGHDIRLAYSGFGLWYLMDADDSWWEEEWPEVMTDAVRIGAGETEETGYHASDIRSIDIEFGGSNLIIQESEDDYVRIARDSDARAVKYQLKNGTFRLYSERGVRWWNGGSRGTVYLYLPRGMNLDSIDLETGAGTLECIALAADEIDVETDAGVAMIDGLYGDEIDVSANAGKVEIYEMTAKNVCADTGAGSLTVQNLTTEDIELTASAGSLDVEGKIGRNADIECGVGSVSMTLQGAETDYDYQLECSMGEIDINGTEYTGIAKERDIRNGGKGVLDIECSMGSVVIRFTD